MYHRVQLEWDQEALDCYQARDFTQAQTCPQTARFWPLIVNNGPSSCRGVYTDVLQLPQEPRITSCARPQANIFKMLKITFRFTSLAQPLWKSAVPKNAVHRNVVIIITVFFF
ncbi:hypothetical protein ROHU_003385 [Labeo rohita]|uniref:Uncharacterized protein n=1 Tax=Labeo rohita TaxID=84645 RepID=A0A498NWB5_LABRO|nr:hypothetical protein ROHU_003385 [Labeo rohita]